MFWEAAVALTVVAAALGFWLGLRRSTDRTRIALERAHGEHHRLVEKLQTLHRIENFTSESLDANAIANSAVELVHEWFGAQGTLIALVQRGDQPLRVVRGLGSLTQHTGQSFTEDVGGLLIRSIGSEATIVASEGDASKNVLFPGAAMQRGWVVPLRVHGETLGAMVVDQPREDEPSLEPLKDACCQTALLLYNARFFEMLRDGKEQWETVFDALSDGVAVLDASACIRRANRSLANLVNLPTMAVRGRRLSNLLFGNADTLNELLSASAPLDGRRTMTVPAEHIERLLQITVLPMSGRLAKAGWTVALVEDVTEQKTMETHLAQNERMIAVGQLVSGVAHELNNPLTSISGLSEFLATRATSAADREHLTVIQEQAERANRIVSNLLTFARTGPKELTDLNLSSMAQRATALLEYELRLQAIHLVTDLDPDLPPVRGDQHQLQQVIINLLTNAVHATQNTAEEREARVTVTTGRKGDWVYLLVTDTGPGIDPKDTPNVFIPFFTTKAPGKGTGLGLSIAYRIVETHDGTLSVQSTGSQGSTFRMELPIATNPVAVDSDSPTGVRQKMERVRNRKILIVDADPAIRRMISTLLTDAAGSVSETETLDGAIQQLEQNEFDVIIADPRIGTLAGDDAFADLMLRRWPRLTRQTIFMTADVREQTRQWLDRLGCRVLHKPFSVRQFMDAAGQVLLEEPRRRLTPRP